ncbi:unnamed protein product [Dibothriocephalus latus]|uniref:Protein arginine methyltransferase NDUFAF7 n=1 Tax=Dibothriocephalus latus TaxID=60516 RepID=A0A3P7LQ66_DIBLA|nr:unnamed protein product [Dibothriocephalus latus]
MRFRTQTPFDIVEFGPGRGTLSSNILRAISKFPKVASELQNLHLIERSDRLRAIQQSTLSPLLEALKPSPKIHWHSYLDEIPRGRCSYYFAHEFFDALPIHRFQKVDGKWHEVFVDVMDTLSESSSQDAAQQLIFRASRAPTLTMNAYLKAFKNHELHDPLKDPGQADITADVDFAFLQSSIEAANIPGKFFLLHQYITNGSPSTGFVD